MVGYLQLDGVDDYGVIPATSLIAGSLPRTVKIKFSTKSNTSGFLFTWGNNTTNKAFGAYFRSGELRSNFSSAIVKITDIIIDQTYELTMTYDGSNVRSYINGSLLITQPILLDTPSINGAFGQRIWSTDFFKGNVYDFKIWNVALSLEEINNGTTINPIVHYDMSKGNVQDQSGNGRHATLIGGTWVNDTPPTTIIEAGELIGSSQTNVTASASIVYKGDGTGTSETNATVAGFIVYKGEGNGTAESNGSITISGTQYGEGSGAAETIGNGNGIKIVYGQFSGNAETNGMGTGNKVLTGEGLGTSETLANLGLDNFVWGEGVGTADNTATVSGSILYYGLGSGLALSEATGIASITFMGEGIGLGLTSVTVEVIEDYYAKIIRGELVIIRKRYGESKLIRKVAGEVKL